VNVLEKSIKNTTNTLKRRSFCRITAIVFTLVSSLCFTAATSAFQGMGAGAVYAAQKIPAKAEQKTGISGNVFSNDKGSIDASNMEEGYVLLKYTGGKSIPIKIQITKKGGETTPTT
jgi:hypothetical protein